MPRATKSSPKTRHNPLHLEIHQDETFTKFGRITQPGKRQKSKRRSEDDDDDNIQTLLDTKTSKKIFNLARDQQNELEDEEGVISEDEDEDVSHSMKAPRTKPGFDLEDDDDDRGIDYDVAEDPGDVEETFGIDQGDREALETLHPANLGERKTLADVIFSKLPALEVESGGTMAVIQDQGQEAPDPAAGLDPRIVETYTKIAVVLQRHRSGPLPKLFKVIPSFPAWARILALTQPENWSPHACRAATKIFISTLKPPQAQLFIRVVLLDAIRSDIQANKKLNPQYFEALKKALYKPAAFFKGLIFPILEQGCTLKEAAIIASVLSRKKIPVLHAAAALLRIAEMDYSGPNSLFIRVLLDKKMQLPYKAVDALVFHFIRLSNTYKAKTRADAEKLPVLWHQSLLVFAQRYGSDLTPDQKDALLDVVKATPHVQISPEIRRELISSVVRGAPREGDEDVEMS